MRKFRLLVEAAQRRYVDELEDRAVSLRMAMGDGDAFKAYLKTLRGEDGNG